MNKDILHQLEKVQSKLTEHDDQLLVIFDYIKQLEQIKHEEEEFKNRKRIGFK